MVQFDHIVIGAGINGSCTAYKLAQRGAKVLLLEKFPLPHSRGSSHGQSRGIRRAYPDAFFTGLMKQAYKDWEEIENKTGVKLINETGLLCFSNEKCDYIQNIIKSFKNSPGSKSRSLKAADIRRDYPYINVEDGAEGCFDPSGGVIMADKALKCVLELCKQLGVEIVDGDGVDNLTVNDHFVEVKTSSGRRLTAKTGVICAGPWSGQILAKLGYRLPLKPIKIPVYYWKVNSDFLPHTWIYEDSSGHVWGLPPLEYPGYAKICPHDGPMIDPDRRDSVTTEYLKKKMSDFIRDHYPGVSTVPSIEESCIYTMTPDQNPIIDTLPTHPNIAIGVGFSGTGFKLGPVTGSMLADLAQGIKDKQDVPLLSISRFPSSNL